MRVAARAGARGLHERTAGRAAAGPVAAPSNSHVPPFARWPYQLFSREAVVQIASREWRAFGQPIVYPDTELPFDNAPEPRDLVLVKSATAPVKRCRDPRDATPMPGDEPAGPALDVEPSLNGGPHSGYS